LKGRLNSRIEDILENLQEFGEIPEALQEKISSEKNCDTLKKWCKLSHKIKSINEFESLIS
ncbi:MAG: hypothetical protein ACRC7N_21055, partial [Clostridium sp.]